MISYLDKLNLRPQERRLVVVVALAVFVVLNLWFVWPHFGDWAKAKSARARAETTMKRYQDEIARVPGYEKRLVELESEGGSVVTDEQQLDLLLTVQNQSRKHDVTVTSYDPRPKTVLTETNRFFEEQTLTIHVNTGNEELVNFLVSLASTNSLIRVRDMRLNPDPTGTRLNGDITLVASYQKKLPASRAPATAAPAQTTATDKKAVVKGATNTPPSVKSAPAVTSASKTKS